MARETKSGLLPKRKTNAEKMKEAREAKSQAEDRVDSSESAQVRSDLTEPEIQATEAMISPIEDLSDIGKAAGKIVQERPKGYRPVQYVETKTKRVQLVFQPSLHERVKRAATKRNLSINEYIHQILDFATQNE